MQTKKKLCSFQIYLFECIEEKAVDETALFQKLLLYKSKQFIDLYLQTFYQR